MNDVYSQEFHVRWSDLDPNFHMRHSAYADLCAATRFQYLETLGFSAKKFAELKVGPIIFNENINYLSEVLPGDKVMVSVQIAGLSQDGRKWKMFHEIKRISDGKLAATLEITGAWFDILKRKVTPAPEVLRKQISTLPRTKNFQDL